MALRFQDLEIPLGVGVDTKSSQKVVQPGALLRAENAVLSKPGEARKRNGYDKVPMIRDDGTKVDNVKRVYSDGESLIAAADGRAEGYEEESGRWRDVGSMGCFRVTRQRLLRSTGDINADPGPVPMHEMAAARGFAVHARNDQLASPDVFSYSVVNVETGEAVVKEATISGGLSKLGLCSYKDRYVVIIYYTSTELRAAFIDMQNPATAPAAHILASDIDSISSHHKSGRVVEVKATGKCVAYYEANPPAPNTGALVEFDENGTTGNSVQLTGTASTTAALIEADSGGFIYVCMSDAVEVADPDWATLYGPTAASTNPSCLMVEQDGGSGINLYTYETDSDFGSIAEERYLQVQTVSNAAVIGSASTVLRGVYPYGMAFNRNGVTYLLVRMDTGDELQNSFFLIDGDGNVLSRITVNNALTPDLGTAGERLVGRAYIKDSDVVHVFYRDAANSLFSAKLDFSRMGNEAQLGSSQFIAASQLYEFDGTSLVESGFHHYPSKMSAVNAAGGNIAAATYLYKAVYRWTDRGGGVHYSSTSTAFSYVLGASTRKITVSITPLKLTQKEGVEILLFRTIGGGTDYYFVASENNDSTANKVDILDNLADATLLANAAIYTAGGVLDNLSPPSPTVIESFGNRLFAITDDNIIHYTKKIQEDRGAEFAGEFRLIFDQRGGSLASMKGQEYQMIVTRERAIGRLQGAGPNDKGTGGDFAITDSIPSESGAALGSPMLETSFGTMFKSADKGIFLLDRSLQAVYAGAAVETYNEKPISDTGAHPARNEVLFSHYTGELLRLDTLQKQWVVDAVSVGGGLTSIAVLRGKVYASTAGGDVVREGDGFRDGASYFPLVVETPQIHVSGLAGFQRVPRLYIVGTYVSPHTLNVWIYYDDEAEPSEKVERVLASPGGPVRIKPRRQKCTSMKLLIFDSDQSGSGESIRLNAVRFTIGLKPKATNYRGKGN